MASTSQKPKKGILKHSGSVDHGKKEIEWDEMNILATYHPVDKDYGHMKVDEPPTPYNRAAISDSEDEVNQERKGSISSLGALDPDQLAKRLEFSGEPSVNKQFYDDGDNDDDDDDDDAEHENETEEERKRRKAFLLKRKMHYNEFAAVQLAKKLMAEDEDEDEDNGDEGKKQKSESAPVVISEATENPSEQTGSTAEDDTSTELPASGGEGLE